MSYTQLNAPPLTLNPAILGGGNQPPYPGPGYPPQDGNIHPQPMENVSPTPMTNQPKTSMCCLPPESKQPGGDGNWMPIPTGIPVCPPGLKYLTTTDQLVVNQKVAQTEGCDIKNIYTIKNSLRQKIYTTQEDTDCCTRNCCGNDRPFEMKIKDNAGNEVIHLVRELACDCCLCPCCLQKLEVMSPPGVPCGRVVQEWSILSTRYRVENESGETVLNIKGPFCTSFNNEDMELEVLSNDGVKVGKITKQWSSGLSKEAFKEADHFGITFPVNLDVKVKAALLGALFLIDYMFYEKKIYEENEIMDCCKCLECLLIFQ